MTPCRDWSGPHDCGLPDDHDGDHRCGGCGDVWNRYGTPEFERADSLDPFFTEQRDRDWPHELRCAAAPV